jgi:hypothetical protein
MQNVTERAKKRIKFRKLDFLFAASSFAGV